MIPMFFGPTERPLFGAYHPAAGRGARGVVICNPWGREYLCAHQSLCLLARQLAAGGHHVLRFDYGGTGDSAGKGTEASLQSWRADLDWALDEIRDLAGVRDVAVIGLRLGATVAAAAAAERREIDRLVLWEPVVDGIAYVEELLRDPEMVTRSNVHERLADKEDGEILEIGGFALTPKMRRDIEDISGAHYDRALPSTLLVSLQSDSGNDNPLATRLSDRIEAFCSQQTEDPLVWLETDDFGAGGISVNTVHVIDEWLA